LKKEKTTIVLIASILLNSPLQSSQSLAEGLSKKDYRVIYVEPFPRKFPTFKNFNRVWYRFLRACKFSTSVNKSGTRSFLVLTPFALPDNFFVFRWINSHWFIPKTVNTILNDLSSSQLIVINFFPSYSSLMLQESLNPTLKVYGCFLDWQNNPFASQSNRKVEQKIISQSDLIITDSVFLEKKHASVHPNVKLFFPGVDDYFFVGTTQKKSQEPILAYFGSISTNINIDLLKTLSYQYHLRIIGPMSVSQKGFSKNTEFIGLVPATELPGLLQDVDVLLLPYSQKAKHNQGTFPAKTFQCLALGIPTVAIGLPNLAEYSDYFYLCQNEEAFFDSIKKALVEDNPQLRKKRIELARQNSWQTRIEQFDCLIKENLVLKIGAE
jgi:glycosyltransferase involved in cell wall biosynthesis